LACGWIDPDGVKNADLLTKIEKDLREQGSIGPIIGYFEEKEKPGPVKTFFTRVIISYLNDVEALKALVLSAESLGVTEEDLKNISIPLLSIVGTKDPFLDSSIEMVKRVPNAQQATIEGGNHIMTPSRKQMHHALLEFLGEHSSD